jgi:hydroxymethylbilane synthase
MRVIVVGTRGSLVGLAHTRWLVERLKEDWPEAEFKIKALSLNDKGPLETHRELHQALLAREIDIALYSLKHLPSEEMAGCRLVAVPRRSDPREVFSGKTFKRLEDLPKGAVVGASSPLRQAQLRAYRPDLQIRELKGEVEERLAALAHQVDGVVLGAASLLRLDLRNRIDQFVDPSIMLPAPGQGALGLVVRQGDDWAEELAYSQNHRPSFDRTLAERSFLQGLGAPLESPVGALALAPEDGSLHLEGVILSPDGLELIRGEIDGEASEARELGSELALDLLEQGGKELLARLRTHAN